MTGTSSSTLPAFRLTAEEVAELNTQFERTDPTLILRWAFETVPDGRLVLSTTFGVGGMVIIHLLADEGIRLPLVFLETLYHFPETIEHAERVADRYGLELRVHRPASSRKEFEAKYGARLWERDEDLFHRLTKVEPMKGALDGVDGWITGRRRDQSPTRNSLSHVELNDRIKINPLASWNLDLVWEFIRAHKIPYNPLHDLGYASIGDAPLTTPIKPGEHERAGRWRGSARLECGLHGI